VPQVDFKTAIADFLKLGRRLHAAKPLTGQQALDELTAF
jgi:hypothetical protein